MSVLEFISSLKWPVVVLVAMGVVSRGFKRNPDMGAWFRGWLDSRDVRGKIAGAEFEAKAAESLRRAALSDDTLQGAVIELTASSDAPADEEQPVDQVVAALRRDAVEGLMRDAAAWGWEMAQLGFKTPPDPQVSWGEDGQPVISYGVGTPITRTVLPRPSETLDAAELRRRASLQEAIRRRIEEIEHRGG